MIVKGVSTASKRRPRCYCRRLAAPACDVAEATARYFVHTVGCVPWTFATPIMLAATLSRVGARILHVVSARSDGVPVEAFGAGIRRTSASAPGKLASANAAAVRSEKNVASAAPTPA